MKANYEKVLRETLSEDAFELVSANDEEFKKWLERLQWHVKKIGESMDLFQKNVAVEPNEKGLPRCPRCDMVNKMVARRRITIKNKDEEAQCTIYCWNCGQKLLIK